MPQKHNKYVSPNQISIELNGETYNGSYTVVNGIITVSYDMTSETTQVGGMPPETLAKLLLSELVRKGDS